MKQALSETFEDTGCELHPRCLDCPEPVCIEDMDGYERYKYLRSKGIKVTAKTRRL